MQQIHLHIEGPLPRSLGLTRAEVRAAAAFFADRSGRRAGEVFRDVTVILQRDADSAAAHHAILGVAGPTDVITQRYDAMPPEPEGVYGEIYVNVDQAARYAAGAPARKGRDWSAAKELLLYIAHGMDHLTGADDHTPRGYAQMRARELAWLRALPPLGVVRR